MNQPHGKYHARVKGGNETDCPEGYTLWHLLASGLLTQAELRPFLVGSKSIKSDTLLDDLQEKMTVFPYHIAWRYEISPTLGYNYDEFRALTGFRSPREICRLRGIPFLTEYVVRKRWIHPVVESFRIQTVKDLGLSKWDVPPIR
jgi:hypothetical protein